MTLTEAIKLLKNKNMRATDLEEVIVFLEQLKADLKLISLDQKGYITGKYDLSNDNFQATINQLNELI